MTTNNTDNLEDKKVMYIDFETLKKLATYDYKMFKEDHKNYSGLFEGNLMKDGIIVFGSGLNGRPIEELNTELNEILPEDHRKNFIISKVFRFVPNILEIAGARTDAEVKELYGKVHENSEPIQLCIGMLIEWHVNNILPELEKYGQKIIPYFAVTEEQKQYMLQKQWKSTYVCYENDFGCIDMQPVDED